MVIPEDAGVDKVVDLFLSFLFDLWIDARAETNPDGSITVHARPMITKDPAFENL
jgi:hypothetical protein